ncbi:phosphatase PAP2 family protein [Streptomyces sp. PSKA54]|uniref:Phosphatase PAP2 family protein n=1 Tax=Streptomyces himalayensis subsp. aureolus TaxID=2758039 RepID=A0A7W2CWY1_9ACTN|nr:phosphatase PAP2 family protein [Streptomyces himalayensis]MBA4860618.1 phosphatase PAP2 family protein [Streptomyces himalayensis subsp. aureolus]
MHPAPLQDPARTHRTLDTRSARAALALAVPSVLLVLLVTLQWGPLVDLDGGISRTTHRWAVAEPELTQVNRILTDWVWDPWTMRALCAATAVWLAWRHRAWWLALWVAATCAIGTCIQQSLKAAVGRERPVWPDPVDSAHYAAFPSGHAMTATVVCGLLLWLIRLYGAGRALWRAAVVLAVFSVIGVGLTRVWLGVHWPSDVLGGWLLGSLLVALAVTSYGRVMPDRRGMPYGDVMQQGDDVPGKTGRNTTWRDGRAQEVRDSGRP